MSSEVLARFGVRAGFSLIKAADVGLPVFRVYAGCLVIETTPTSLVEEYVLRGLMLGVSTHPQLSELLGLPEPVVLAALADMLREGLIFERRQATGAALIVSPAGAKLIEERQRSRPRESELNFLYDGLTHRAVYLREDALMRPKQLRLAGIPEISAIPARGPDAPDLKVEEITNYLKDARPNQQSRLQVLRVLRVDRRERLFLPATALVFRAANSAEEYQVAFVIDSRLSPEHESAFRREGGIDRSSVFSGLKSGREPIDLEKVVGHELATALKAKIEVAPQEKANARPILSLNKSAPSHTDAVRAVVRPLSVVEHNPLMMSAIHEATESVIIISPWVRKEVVNAEFLREVAAALERRVRVTIGYGIKQGEQDDDMDLRVRREFDRLSKKFEHFVVKRLGNTHAKILVKDREFFVLTSFNWLSFRGDPDKQFREEWGTLVQSRGMTEEFLRQELHPRLGIR